MSALMWVEIALIAAWLASVVWVVRCAIDVRRSLKSTQAAIDAHREATKRIGAE